MICDLSTFHLELHPENHVSDGVLWDQKSQQCLSTSRTVLRVQREAYQAVCQRVDVHKLPTYHK